MARYLGVNSAVMRRIWKCELFRGKRWDTIFSHHVSDYERKNM